MHEKEPFQALGPQPQNCFTGSGRRGDRRDEIGELLMLDRFERQAADQSVTLEAEC